MDNLGCKIKITVVFFLIYGINISSSASERLYEYYNHSHLSLSLCYNYTDYNSKLIMKYKGVSSVLNEYIVTKIKDNELENKNLEIDIGCEIFGSHPSIEVTQSDSLNYIFIHSLPSLQYLVRVVNYFGSPSWEPFVIQAKNVDELMMTNDPALKCFNEILDKQVPRVDMTFFEDQKFKVQETGELSIVYYEDNLQLIIGKNNIGSDFGNPTPVRLINRYFIVRNDSIYVFNSIGDVINKFPTYRKESDLDGEFQMKSYSTWMNFYHWDKTKISYSYEKNRFYYLN